MNANATNSRWVILTAIAVSGVFALSSLAFAKNRVYYPDDVVVERAELIVVGHIKRGSVTKVEEERNPNGPANSSPRWHHTAQLVVVETLKGKTEANELTIEISYGLNPIVGKRVSYNGDHFEYPDEAIAILDTATVIPSLVSVADATQDNLWFLRPAGGNVESRPFAVIDPQDVQPLERKALIKRLLIPYYALIRNTLICVAVLGGFYFGMRIETYVKSVLSRKRPEENAIKG
jgi:hypothetical protein